MKDEARFSRVEPLSGERCLHADPETIDDARRRAVVSFGPEHAPLEQRQVAAALEEPQLLVPKPKMVVFASFQFDSEAAKDIDETNWPGITLLKVQMNTDLLTGDLKKKRSSNESFWMIGQPDVEVRRDAGTKGRRDGGKERYVVEVRGFDYYNPIDGKIESGDTSKIAMWMLDTDYDGRSLYPRQVFFPMGGPKHGWARLARNLKAEIDLESLGRKFRLQKVVFETARDIHDQMKPGWKGNKEYLLAQLFGLVEQVIRSDRIVITPPLFNQDDFRRRIIITLSMTKVVQHIWEAIRFENTESLEPIFDSEHPIRCTGDMRPWYTGKPCEVTRRSHISHCVYDSTWEATEAFELERNKRVAAWVKNDHLGYEIMYVYKGIVKKYRPDFLIRLATGKMLVLEVKGQDTQQNRTKREFLAEWVAAVNEHGGFGKWVSDVSFHPGDIADLLAKHDGGGESDGYPST